MDPGVVIFLWAGLQVYYMWRFIERRRGTRTRQRKTRVSSGTPSNYVYVGDNRQVWVGGDKVHPSKPTLEERFALAFYQAWIEPTQEIINRIDAECPDPESEVVDMPPEVVQTDLDAAWALSREVVRLRQENQVLQSRLKETLDHAIDLANRNATHSLARAIDTRRMIR